jgi:glycosyltransferase involved in cell wall biosynthesis
MNTHAQSEPLVSIIVPTRNRPGLLQKALASILAQRSDRYEVIVVDDGSDEHHRAAYPHLPELTNPRVRLHLLGLPGQHGSGPSVVRNAGLAIAGGSVITFLDDDDHWTDVEHLSRMIAAFQAAPPADAYIACQQAIRPDGSVAPAAWLPGLTKQFSIPTVVRLHDGLATLIAAGGFAHLNIYALRRDIALAVGGFWERTNYEEDRDFFWRSIDRCTTVAFDPRIVSQHNIPDRAQQANVTTRYSQTERWLVSLLVSQHIAVSVASSRIAYMSRGYEGDILRHLSRHYAVEKRNDLALHFARMALAARHSWKWRAYTYYLTLLTFGRTT